MQKKYKKKELDIDEWGLVNIKTGEIKNPEIGRLTLETPTKEVSTNFNHYLYLDTDRLQLLFLNGMTETELGFLLFISRNLSFSYNVCMLTKDKPFTTKLIADMLGQAWISANRKLKKLIQLNVLEHKKIPGQEHLGKVYIVNPYFLKRGKNQNEFLAKIFFDFTDPSDQTSFKQ